MVEQDKEQYNEDELCAPEWMNKEYFEKILRETNNDDSIEVTHLVTKPGSLAGDHYASVMFRAVLNYNTKSAKDLEKSLIIKTMPFVDGPKKEMLAGMNMFDVEIKMYKEVIPKFQKMLKDIGDETQLGGKCLYASSEPHEVLVFDDLTKDDYKTITKWGGSWAVGKKAVEKLAKWQAMSFKMVSDGDESMQSFNENGFTNGNMVNAPTFKYGFKNFVDMLKKDPELEQYTSKFEHLLEQDPMNKSIALYKAFVNGDKANLFVLNHGDFHIKNLMFTETESGEVDDVLLVDFQMCIWGPAVIDLTYMLYMMMEEDERLDRRNEIIHYYFETFTETLKKLGFSGEYPKLTDLYKDFLTYKDFGKLKYIFLYRFFSICIFLELLLLTTMLPFIMAIKENPALDIGAVLHGENAGKALYETESYQKYVKKVLPSLLHRGYLD